MINMKQRKIDVFDGENRFLSNFYYAPIIYNGKKIQ